MKNCLMVLALGTLMISGCASKNEGIILDNQSTEMKKISVTDIQNSDFLQENALHDAVRTRDIDAVQFLLDQKIAINEMNSEGYTALHIAVRLQEFEIVQLLVESGASVNSVDKYDDMPLLDSTRDNYTEISKFLICNGAKRDVVDRYNMSALNHSTKNMNFEVSQMLLAENLDPYCGKEEEVVAQEEVLNAEVKQETNAVALVGLYDALMEEFQEDFDKWDAELTKDDLVFRFNNPLALFELGKSDLRVGFTDILSDFFPRYLAIIEQYKAQIKEIRIEGHSSSEYRNAKTVEEKYLLNEELSKQRAETVRDYSVNQTLDTTEIEQEWVENSFQAYGMSSSDLILNTDGSENVTASRRVDFKIVQIEL